MTIAATTKPLARLGVGVAIVAVATRATVHSIKSFFLTKSSNQFFLTKSKLEQKPRRRLCEIAHIFRNFNQPSSRATKICKLDGSLFIGQHHAQQRAVDLDMTVIGDEPKFSEFVHEMTDA